MPYVRLVYMGDTDLRAGLKLVPSSTGQSDRPFKREGREVEGRRGDELRIQNQKLQTSL